jgi:N-acetylglucosaminyldiphosphoundecaprenol N-acetyl-beta-D-mannosaminyltransferase
MVGRTEILGVPISLIDIGEAVSTILGWVKRREQQFVCVRDAPSLMHAADNHEWMRIQHIAGMVTPDGMPLVWIAHLRGYWSVQRVSGADLVDALCEASQAQGIKHFFYGGKPGVAEKMAKRLIAKYPKLQSAGTYTPPFGDISEEEDSHVVDLITVSGAKIVWVGISTPKQEYWMRDHVKRIPGATLIGVGAAFDFHSGTITRAPRLMQRAGLEWLHRLWREPRRLWKRYLIMAPRFLSAVMVEQLQLLFSPKLGVRDGRVR